MHTHLHSSQQAPSLSFPTQRRQNIPLCARLRTGPICQIQDTNGLSSTRQDYPETRQVRGSVRCLTHYCPGANQMSQKHLQQDFAPNKTASMGASGSCTEGAVSRCLWRSWWDSGAQFRVVVAYLRGRYTVTWDPLHE
jgi:hypothetical protein